MNIRQFGKRVACALVAILSFAILARADIPPGPYKPKPQPTEVPHEKPGTCGSGVGLALAGVAAVWGVMLAGRRARVRSRISSMVAVAR